MPTADFYLIDTPRFREAPLLLVCELVKKAYAAEWPTLVFARDVEQAEVLDELLWAFEPDAYIPHQIAGDEDDELTPVLIVPPGTDTPPRRLAINLREDCVERHDQVKEVVPAEDEERAGSRRRWAEYKRRGFEVRKFDM